MDGVGALATNSGQFGHCRAWLVTRAVLEPPGEEPGALYTKLKIKRLKKYPTIHRGMPAVHVQTSAIRGKGRFSDAINYGHESLGIWTSKGNLHVISPFWCIYETPLPSSQRLSKGSPGKLLSAWRRWTLNKSSSASPPSHSAACHACPCSAHVSQS